MQTHRDAVRSRLTLIEGGKPAAPVAPPDSPMIGFMHVHDAETGESGGYGKVAITPRPDGTYLVRPVRGGETGWKDA